MALLLLGACGFSARAAPDASAFHDAPHDGALGGSDAGVTPDAPITAEPFMLACSPDTLYKIDVDTQTATPIGPISNGSTPLSIFALAGTATLLYAIPQSLNVLLSVDPATGAVTQSHALTPKHDYYGFTYAPAGALQPQPVWFAATDGTGEPDGGSAHLFTVNIATGATTIVGQFGGGLTIAGDLAWVQGKGLFGTFYGPMCDSATCVASIDPATGAATILTTTGPPNALSLSGFRGLLWALDTGGGIWLVDTTTGNSTLQFTTSIQWADGAL
jgi:hypothetical protein